MSALFIEESIPVVTPLGDGLALIFESEREKNWWTVVLDESGAIITFAQDKIRVRNCYSHGRGVSHEKMKQRIRGNVGSPNATDDNGKA